MHNLEAGVIFLGVFVFVNPPGFSTLTTNIRPIHKGFLWSVNTLVPNRNWSFGWNSTTQTIRCAYHRLRTIVYKKRIITTWKGPLCLIPPTPCPAVPAQPVSFLGERQLHGIIATCHSQVNSPPSLCSGEQSLFSLSNVGALQLPFEPWSANAFILTSHTLSYIQPEHFVVFKHTNTLATRFKVREVVLSWTIKADLCTFIKTGNTPTNWVPFLLKTNKIL